MAITAISSVRKCASGSVENASIAGREPKELAACVNGTNPYILVT